MPYQNNAQRSAYTKTESNTKRNYISSGNFKKSTSFQVFHNANIRPDYAIGGEIICNLNGYEALELKNKIIAEAKEAYEKNKKPKAPSFKAKSYEWSLVVNLKPESTMQDLEKLAQHFSDKYGFQCYQIAIHRDEGHINEQGEKVINHHAHMEFITLDKQTGKNNYNREKISPKVLREMQTEVAEILQMERGQDKRLSGRQRIEPRKYAQMKEAEKKVIKALTQQLENAYEVIEILFQESLPQEKKFTKEKIAKEKIRITINQSKKVRELFTETIKTRIQINTLKEIKNTIFKRF